MPRDELTINGEPKVIEVPRDQGGVTYRHFCGNCGSPLISILDDAQDLAWIKAGTLNDTSSLEPELEAWTRSAQPWALVEREDRGYFPQGIPTG